MRLRRSVGGLVVGLVLLASTCACTKGDESASRPVETAPASKSGANPVYIVSVTGEALHKPSSFKTPAGGVMKNIEWLSYGGDIALGEGMWYGRRTTFKLTTISDCRGYRAYLYVTYTSGGGKPPPFPVSYCRESDIANPT